MEEEDDTQSVDVEMPTTSDQTTTKRKRLRIQDDDDDEEEEEVVPFKIRKVSEILIHEATLFFFQHLASFRKQIFLLVASNRIRYYTLALPQLFSS